MDKKDEQIIEVLEKNSRLSTREIAKKTRIPITTIYNRINKLEESGVIEKFTIITDPKKMGKNIAVYILVHADIEVLKDKEKTQHMVAEEIKKLQGVEKVSIITGDADLVVFLRVKDIEELDKTLLKKIQNIEGVGNTKTLVVLDEY